MVKAWIYDDIEGDQRLPHNEGDSTPVSIADLKKVGVLAWEGIGDEEVEKIAKERSYKNRDTISVSKEGLGDLYETKLKGFFREHLHEDEEIRYILEGEGYFDVRDINDTRWIRINVLPQDLLVVPPGIYHRFTLSSSNYVKALRLFQDEPKWVPHDRSAEVDQLEKRKEYLKVLGQGIAA